MDFIKDFERDVLEHLLKYNKKAFYLTGSVDPEKTDASLCSDKLEEVWDGYSRHYALEALKRKLGACVDRVARVDGEATKEEMFNAADRAKKVLDQLGLILGNASMLGMAEYWTFDGILKGIDKGVLPELVEGLKEKSVRAIVKDALALAETKDIKRSCDRMGLISEWLKYEFEKTHRSITCREIGSILKEECGFEKPNLTEKPTRTLRNWGKRGRAKYPDLFPPEVENN